MGSLRDVAVLGIGQTPVDEHWESSLRDLGYQALSAALDDAQVQAPQMLFVGNMLSGALSSQENLGALIADYAGFRGVEAVKVEAACASGAAAVRMAWMAVAGGLCDLAVALGVEKMTDGRSEQATAALMNRSVSLRTFWSSETVSPLLLSSYSWKVSRNVWRMPSLNSRMPDD